MDFLLFIMLCKWLLVSDESEMARALVSGQRGRGGGEEGG